jgi:Uma2 family endonuclease
MATTTEEIKAQESQTEATASLVRRFSLAEFAAVADVLPDDRLELINGEIIMVPPPDKLRMKRTNRLIELFAHHVKKITALGGQISGSNCYYAVPKDLQQRWVEEGTKGPDNVCPDASICYRDYLDTDRRPPALLVVEVLSVSKQEHIDRGLSIKTEIYATLEIPAYWVVDRRDQSVWVYTAPKDRKYRSCQSYQGNQALPAPGLEFLQLTPAQIFEQ